MNRRSAIETIACSEPNGGDGTQYTKGRLLIAQADFERGVWLDEQLATQRVETRRIQKRMKAPPTPKLEPA